MRIAAMTSAVLLVSAAVYAQDETARRQAVEVAARVPLERAFKGAPYSAETIVESNQPLADGNRISRKTNGRVYRDGEGRTRREQDAAVSVRAGSGVTTTLRTTISIVDPVAGFTYSLDTENKIAWRTPIGVGGAIMGKLEAAQTAVRRTQEESVNAAGQREVRMSSTPLSDEEKQKVEAAAKAARIAGAEDAQSKAAAVEQQKVAAATASGGGGGRGGAVARGGGLGAVEMAGRGYAIVPAGPLEHKMIDGLPVEGRKTTTVIPAGQIGNEQPITITSEEWRSPDLDVLVMTHHTDPRTGESSYRLTNVIRAEPDPSLFMVPADYTVKETGIKRMLEASQRK